MINPHIIKISIKEEWKFKFKHDKRLLYVKHTVSITIHNAHLLNIIYFGNILFINECFNAGGEATNICISNIRKLTF